MLYLTKGSLPAVLRGDRGKVTGEAGAFAVLCVRDDNDLNQGSNGKGCEKWLDSG